MQENKKQGYGKSFWEKARMWLMVRKTVRKTRHNIRHGRMMAAFYSNLQRQAIDNKKLHGDLGLKVGQLEDSVAQEMRFLDFVSGMDLDDPQLWKGADE